MNMLWLATLLVLASGAPAAETSRAPLKAPTPLAQLSESLNTILPRLPELVPLQPLPQVWSEIAAKQPVQSVIPALHAQERAQTLAARAEELTKADLRRASQRPNKLGTSESTAPEPLAALEAVNAVFKDFTPDALSTLPLETLQGLASLVLDHLQGRAGTHTEGLRALAERRVEMTRSRRGKVEEVLLNPGHNDMHPDDIVVHGVPDRVRLVRPTQEPPRGRDSLPIKASPLVLRHYTTKEGYEQIMASRSIWNGHIPYMERSPNTYRKTYKDLTGVFFTLPGVPGDSVGVPQGQFDHYVDVLLPAGMPILELEAGRILLVPLPSRMREWLRSTYLEWVGTGKSQTTSNKTIRDIEAAGGPGPNLALPITILAHGRVK